MACDTASSTATATFRLGAEASLGLPEAAAAERLCLGLIDSSAWVALFGRLAGEAIASVADPDGSRGDSAVDELALGPALAAVFRELGKHEVSVRQTIALMRTLRLLPLPSSVAHLPAGARAAALVRALVADESVRSYIQVNVWEGVSWFNRESFDQLLWWLLAVAVIDVTADPEADDVPAAIVAAYEVIEALQDAEARSDYQVEKLKAALIA